MSISGGRISVITYRTTAVDLDSYPMPSLKLDAPKLLGGSLPRLAGGEALVLPQLPKSFSQLRPHLLE
jgi:hypothetical protein